MKSAHLMLYVNYVGTGSERGPAHAVLYVFKVCGLVFFSHGNFWI